jgi:hypothetical protein
MNIIDKVGLIQYGLTDLMVRLVRENDDQGRNDAAVDDVERIAYHMQELSDELDRRAFPKGPREQG